LSQPVPENDFRYNTYLLISLALAIPVLVWPLALFIGSASESGGIVEKNWLISASLLLLAATVSDSVLASVTSLRQMLQHCVWIAITVAVISVVLRESAAVHLLGVMFFLHAMRSAIALWHDSSNWWLWPAWIRDVVVALSIFLWMFLWPV